MKYGMTFSSFWMLCCIVIKLRRILDCMIGRVWSFFKIDPWRKRKLKQTSWYCKSIWEYNFTENGATLTVNTVEKNWTYHSKVTADYCTCPPTHIVCQVDVWIYQFSKRNLLTQYNTFARTPWKYLDKSAQISAEYKRNMDWKLKLSQGRREMWRGKKLTLPLTVLRPLRRQSQKCLTTEGPVQMPNFSWAKANA